MLAVPGSVENEVVLSPSPLLWLQTFEQANCPSRRARGEPAGFGDSVWAQLQQQVRKRGNVDAPGNDWPGHIYLPVDVVKRLVQEKELLLPEAWRGLPQLQVARVIATLAAWQLERGIYSFTPLAEAIAATSQVDLPLRPVLFANLPSYAIFLDFEALRGSRPRLPFGAFVSLNRDDRGRDELVTVLDWGPRFEVRTFLLQGDLPDTLVSRLLADFRRTLRAAQERAARPGTSGRSTTLHVPSAAASASAGALVPAPRAPQALPHQLRDYDSVLHLILACTLFSCSQALVPQPVRDGAERLGPRPPWRHWEIGRGLEAMLGPDIATAATAAYKGGGPAGQTSDAGALLYARWAPEHATEPIGLRVVVSRSDVRVDYAAEPWGRPRATGDAAPASDHTREARLRRE